MSRARIINHKGKSIIISDLSNFTISTKDKFQEAINEGKSCIAKQPKASVLIVTNVTGLNFDTEMIQKLVEYTAHNKPYIKASAVIGITGLLTIALNAVVKSSLRDIHPFTNEVEACDWLVTQ